MSTPIDLAAMQAKRDAEFDAMKGKFDNEDGGIDYAPEVVKNMVVWWEKTALSRSDTANFDLENYVYHDVAIVNCEGKYRALDPSFGFQPFFDQSEKGTRKSVEWTDFTRTGDLYDFVIGVRPIEAQQQLPAIEEYAFRLLWLNRVQSLGETVRDNARCPEVANNLADIGFKDGIAMRQSGTVYSFKTDVRIFIRKGCTKGYNMHGTEAGTLRSVGADEKHLHFDFFVPREYKVVTVKSLTVDDL